MPVEVFTLARRSGIRLRVMNYGAIVLSLEAADREGRNADVVLGFNTLEPYLAGHPFFGAVVGRFANRIAGGAFTLDGVEHRLALNNHPAGVPCSLHGGLRGFDKVFWSAETLSRPDAAGVRFSYTSPDGEEGYPGNLEVGITYWVTADNAWQIDYEARTDRATPVNLTQHSFFNLRGEGRGDILGHQLSLSADRFTPVHENLIPTGEILPVRGTPLDFTTPHLIGERIGDSHAQLVYGRGYDHNFVFDKPPGVLAPAARVLEPESGRVLEVFTTEPGIQFYTGNFLDGSCIGKSGAPYGFRHGFCLETQHFPDSPNQASFPSSILRPGEVLKSTTVYRFGTGA